MSDDDKTVEPGNGKTKTPDFDLSSLLAPQDMATLAASNLDPAKHTALMLEVVQGMVQISDPIEDVSGIPGAHPGSRIMQISVLVPPGLFAERKVLLASIGSQSHPLDGCVTYIDQARVLVPIVKITDRAQKAIASQYTQAAAMMQRIMDDQGD